MILYDIILHVMLHYSIILYYKSMETVVEEYIASLPDAERQALIIAQDHLGSSFDIEKSIGFMEYREKTKK